MCYNTHGGFVNEKKEALPAADRQTTISVIPSRLPSSVDVIQYSTREREKNTRKIVTILSETSGKSRNTRFWRFESTYYMTTNQGTSTNNLNTYRVIYSRISKHAFYTRMCLLPTIAKRFAQLMSRLR